MDDRDSIDKSSDEESDTDELGNHDVNAIVTFSLSFPRRIDPEGLRAFEMMEKGKKVIPAVKPDHFFHIEYQPIPNRDCVKIDIVTYGTAAKLYIYDSATHSSHSNQSCIRMWNDDDLTWIAFQYKHYINVADHLLEDMFNHKICFKVWDCKEKVSTMARFIKPQGFSFKNKDQFRSQSVAPDEDWNGLKDYLRKNEERNAANGKREIVENAAFTQLPNNRTLIENCQLPVHQVYGTTGLEFKYTYLNNKQSSSLIKPSLLDTRNRSTMLAKNRDTLNAFRESKCVRESVPKQSKNSIVRTSTDRPIERFSILKNTQNSRKFSVVGPGRVSLIGDWTNDCNARSGHRGSLAMAMNSPRKRSTRFGLSALGDDDDTDILDLIGQRTGKGTEPIKRKFQRESVLMRNANARGMKGQSDMMGNVPKESPTSPESPTASATPEPTMSKTTREPMPVRHFQSSMINPLNFQRITRERSSHGENILESSRDTTTNVQRQSRFSSNPSSPIANESEMEHRKSATTPRRVGPVPVNGQIEMALSVLFSGECLLSKNVAGSGEMNDFYVSFQLDRQLLSLKQEQRLNPMVIKLGTVGPLPDSPVSLETLSKHCHPLRCEFDFLGNKWCSEPMELTKQGVLDETNQLRLNTRHVILTGLVPKGLLIEALQGPPLKIIIRDRERIRQRRRTNPSLFGSDVNDSDWSEPNWIHHLDCFNESRYDDPYGYGSVSLAQLAKGNKYLSCSVPILPKTTHRQESSSTSGASVNETTSGEAKKQKDKNSWASFPAGHYLEAGTELRLSIALKWPIGQRAPQQFYGETPFSILIIIDKTEQNGGEKSNIIRKMKIEAQTHNQDIIEKKNIIAQEIMANSLCGGVENPIDGTELIKDADDIISGFSIKFSDIEVLCLEAIQNKGLAKLLKLINSEPEGHTKISLLYDSSISFSTRRYKRFQMSPSDRRRSFGGFGVDGLMDMDYANLSLTNLMCTPELYRQYSVTCNMLKALTKLSKFYQISPTTEESSTILDLIRSDGLLDAMEVDELSSDFMINLVVASNSFNAIGLSLNRNGKENIDDETSRNEGEVNFAQGAEKSRRISYAVKNYSRCRSVLHNYNPGFDKLLCKRNKKEPIDHIAKNKLTSKIVSDYMKNMVKNQWHIQYNYFTSDSITTNFNYSCQKLNNTTIVVNHLRKQLTDAIDKKTDSGLFSFGDVQMFYDKPKFMLPESIKNRQMLFISPKEINKSIKLYKDDSALTKEANMLLPLDIEAAERAEKEKTRKLWKTKIGFQCPGFRTSLECNRPSHTLVPIARKEELEQPWIERKELYRGLEPVLDGRNQWGWDERFEDLDLYSKPPTLFDPTCRFQNHSQAL